MATSKQRAAARKNIKKAQAAWKSMSKRKHSRSQPEGRSRQRPGAGGGEYYRIVIRDKGDFTSFRTQDVGTKGDIKRLAGRRSSGSWNTQAWLIPKNDAHIERGKLVADTSKARQILSKLSSVPKHLRGDRFEARPRRNVPEQEKPTAAQRRAQRENIGKAQRSRSRELVGSHR